MGQASISTQRSSHVQQCTRSSDIQRPGRLQSAKGRTQHFEHHHINTSRTMAFSQAPACPLQNQPAQRCVHVR
jgi:hypothetical protein